MKIFHLGLSSKHVEIGQGNTMQTMQTQNLQQVSNQSWLNLEILYMFWGWIGGDRDILLALKVFGL